MIERKLIGNQVVPIGKAVAYVRVSTDEQAADNTIPGSAPSFRAVVTELVVREYYRRTNESPSCVMVELRAGVSEIIPDSF